MDFYVNIGSGNNDFSLIENDLYRSVLQNLTLLFATKKGTIPMYREFGLEMKFVDKPINIAKPVLIAEAADAVRKFEPRAEVVSVEFEDDTVTGTATPKVKVRIIE